LIAVIDLFVEGGMNFRIDGQIILLDPQEKKIDTIKASDERTFKPHKPDETVRSSWQAVLIQLSKGLHDSRPLQAFAGTRAPASKVAPAGKASPSIVAVFDIQDASKKIDGDALVQLTNYLGTLLTQSGAYRVVPRDQLRQNLLDEKKGSYQECFDERCRIELGKAVSAQKTLATSLIQVGSKCAVTSNLFDLKSETTEKGASVETGCSPDELLSAMKTIAGQLSQ